jgi:GNAT superfamily N-acetyltransferase
MACAPAVRRAVAADRQALLRLWLDLVEHHRRLDPAYPQPPALDETLGRELERGLRSERCRVLVADAGDGPIGFLFGEIEPGPSPAQRGRIQELYVEPDWRRRGLGTALTDAARRWFGERGVDRVAVRVEPANKDGLRFWTRSGFVENARILEWRATDPC